MTHIVIVFLLLDLVTLDGCADGHRFWKSDQMDALQVKMSFCFEKKFVFLVLIIHILQWKAFVWKITAMHNASYHKLGEQLAVHESIFRILTISYPVFRAFIFFLLCNAICEHIYHVVYRYIIKSLFYVHAIICISVHCAFKFCNITRILSPQIVNSQWKQIKDFELLQRCSVPLYECFWE